jgi:hypothetical protein
MEIMERARQELNSMSSCPPRAPVKVEAHVIGPVSRKSCISGKFNNIEEFQKRSWWIEGRWVGENKSKFVDCLLQQLKCAPKDLKMTTGQ